MKSKLKKLFLIVFALSVFISCSVVDLEEHEHGIEASIKSRKISFNEFKSYTKAFNVINDVNKRNVVASTALNRIIRDTIRNFSIDTQEGLYITYANLHSFTFPVYRDVDNGKLENLVLSSQSDGSYKVKLLVYNLTPQEKVDLTLGRLRRVQNPIVTIPIQNFDTNFTEAGSCEEVTTNIFTTCSGAGQHSFAAGNAFECAFWTQGGGTPPTFVTITRIVCVMSDGNGGGSGAGAGAGGPSGGGGDGNEYPANYPSNDTPPEDYNLGISIPITPQLIGNDGPKTPCGKLQDKTKSAEYMNKFNAINTDSNFSLAQETGFAEVTIDGTNSYVDLSPGTAEGTSVKLHPKSKNFTHVHNNKIKIDNVSGDEIDLAFKMLSPPDLRELITTCKTNSIAAGEIAQDSFGTMISDQGIFTITILDNFIDVTQFDNNYVTFIKNYLAKSEKIVLNPNLISSEKRDKLQAMFLSELETVGLQDKIGLFEGTVQTLPDGTKKINWTRKTLGSNGTIVSQPC